MSIEVMIYTTLVALLVGLAALAVERALALALRPRRWLWVAAMVISLAGSAFTTFGGHIPRKAVSAARTPATAKVTLQGVPFPSLLIAAQAPRIRNSAVVPVWTWLETYAKPSWLGASIVLLGLYCLGAWRLLNARRNWPQRSVGQYRVLITKDVGPAVFGVIRPTIVVPRWLLNEPVTTLEAALAHENQHIVARDPALLLAALLLLALTPWNLPLWWQLRRLKSAIEVDCDARVLGMGLDRRFYANTLLRINQYSGALPLGTIAIVGRISQIETRIRAMMIERPRHIGLWVGGWAAVAIPLLVAAAQLNPPSSAPSAPGAPTAHLGINLADFDVNTATASVAAPRYRGALITAVRPGDVADRAGLKRGDVVFKMGDTAIDGARTMADTVARTAPGARVSLVFQRGNVKHTVLVDFSVAPPAQPRPVATADTADWDSLRDANLPIARPRLREELIRMSRLDEETALFRSQSQEMSKEPLTPDTGRISIGLRRQPGEGEANVRRLRQIIAQYGWPTVSMVGVRGSTAAGQIAIFARNDPAFQAQVLGLMEPLMQRDEVPAMYYASLFDAVHTPQRYGNEQECKNGLSVPTKPIEDPQHLEERRVALGLPKLPKFCVWSTGAKAAVPNAP